MFQPQILRYGSLLDQFPEFQLLRRGYNRLSSAVPYGTEFPAINVWVGQTDAILMSELPGIDPEKLDISVINDVLKISGSRTSENIKEGKSYYRQERNSGPFARTLQLPFPVDASKVEAKYENGILQIILPRAEADKPKKITVKRDEKEV